MKVLKLIISIIGVCLGGLGLLQATALSEYDVEGFLDFSSDAAAFAVAMIAAGIVGICTRKKSRWACIIIAVLYAAAGTFAYYSSELFSELGLGETDFTYYALIAYIFAVVYGVLFRFTVAAPKATITAEEAPAPVAAYSGLESGADVYAEESSLSVSEQIYTYKELLDIGVISTERYNSVKRELLDGRNAGNENANNIDLEMELFTYKELLAAGGITQNDYEAQKAFIAQKASERNKSASEKMAEELLVYKNLLDVGAITQEEYEIKKKELLKN